MSRWRRLRSRVIGAALVTAVCLAGATVPAPATHAAPADRFGDLEWTFVRIRYHAWPEADDRYRRDYGSEPWAIDSPSADYNVSRRLRTATSIVVHDPIVGLTLDDPQLFAHPWIYFVEPGTLHLTTEDVSILREFLLRGGTATFDDFHGPIEWENLARELARVFPDRPIVDLAPPHPIFSCFYPVASYPQIPGLCSFLNGRTWEKGGFVARLRTILDAAGRPMVMINWNTDMGDGWEWSNAEQYPGYIKYTADAYRMGINEIVYSLTH